MKRATKAGFTLVEIMIVVAIIALLAAIAIPNVLRGRLTANESAAIGNLRAMISSLEMYRSVYGAYPQRANWNTQMYVPQPPFGPPSFSAATLGSSGLGVQGYQYIYTDGSSSQSYVLTAGPVTSGRTGSRGFRTSEQGTIQHCSSLADLQFPDGTGDLTIDTTPQNCP